MSKIDELLKNEKVEWKEIGEVFEIRNGYTPSKSNKEFWENGTIPWFRMDDLREQGKILKDSKQHITEKAIKGKCLFKSGSIILATTATIGEHAMLIADSLANQQFTNFNICKSLKDKLLPKYVFYYFDVIDEWCKHHTKVSSFPAVNMDALFELEIPIPSLKTQEKIVKILDEFTNYITELQAELQARIKQYEYYRDLLLSEEYLNKLSENPEILGGEYRVRLTTLGGIGVFIRGNGLQKKDFISKGKPVIHYGQIYTQYGFETDKTISYVSDDVFSKLKKAKFNDILIATTSENIEDVGKCVVWLGSEEIGFSGDMYSYSTTENSKYIAYYFQTTEFQRQKEKKVTGTKLIRIHGDDIAKISISLPPIEIQNKVVEILDKFQSLLSDTKGLLPQEIEQRQKQYEYYREKLLTFNVESDTILQTNKQTNIRKLKDKNRNQK